jgi:predicted transcriptional regulator
MARPKQPTPTEAELEILKVVWDRGTCTVRDVLSLLNERRPRAYTSVMSLLNIMVEKGLVTRQSRGKAFVYQAKSPRDSVLRRMVSHLLGGAFEGSPGLLVAHLLDESQPSAEEMTEIRRVIEKFQKQGKT